MRGRTIKAAMIAATLLVAVESADAGVGYYYSAPSIYVGPPVAVYYQPTYYQPAPVAVVAPIAPSIPVYQPAYYLPPAPAVVYTPVYSAPTYTYVPAAPVTVRSSSHTWFGRYQKNRYEIRTPYGRHKYKVTYDLWDGDVDYDYDFDD